MNNINLSSPTLFRYWHFSDLREKHDKMTRRSKNAPLLVLLLWTRWYFSVSAYSYSNTDASIRKSKVGNDLTPIHNMERLDTLNSGRRLFLSTLISGGIVAMVNPTNAMAADSSNKISTTGYTYGYGSGTTGTVAVSKKVGGLANKIRGICLHMVRDRWYIVGCLIRFVPRLIHPSNTLIFLLCHIRCRMNYKET